MKTKAKAKATGILLDTHVWIWLNNGDVAELKPAVIRDIDQAAQSGLLYVSAISVWEVATLVAKKRIVLRNAMQQWVDLALGQPGVQLATLSPAIAVESTQLPVGINGDPADRIIVATARMHSLKLLTRDENILQYGKMGFLNVMKV